MTLISRPVRAVKSAVETARPILAPVSVALWMAAYVFGMVGVAVSILDGRTPVTELLFAVTFLAGVHGGLVDLIRWVIR